MFSFMHNSPRRARAVAIAQTKNAATVAIVKLAVLATGATAALLALPKIF
jgi:hypothetical protein